MNTICFVWNQIQTACNKFVSTFLLFCQIVYNKRVFIGILSGWQFMYRIKDWWAGNLGMSKSMGKIVPREIMGDWVQVMQTESLHHWSHGKVYFTGNRKTLLPQDSPVSINCRLLCSCGIHSADLWSVHHFMLNTSWTAKVSFKMAKKLPWTGFSWNLSSCKLFRPYMDRWVQGFLQMWQIKIY